jgi:hypothetical protein
VSADPDKDLQDSIDRLDLLIDATEDVEKLRAGLGVRLALGFAKELREVRPLGSQTGEMVAEWVRQYGQDTVDAAVTIAREFLTKPEELRKALGRRLGLGKTE